jgi:hypothetical protein
MPINQYSGIPRFVPFGSPESVFRSASAGRVNWSPYSSRKNIDTLSAGRTHLVLESFDPLSGDI